MTEKNRKNVLILTADAGFGHRSAANAVSAALKERHGDECNVEIVNPMEDKRTPFFLRDSQTDYDKIVRTVPELYKLGFEASDAPVPGVIAESALTVMLYEVMRDIIKTFKPDVIVSTFPLYQAPLNAVFTVYRRKIPMLTVVTDLVTIHRLWFNNSVDLLLVPTPYVRDLAKASNISEEKIRITGIPVNPEIVHEKRSPAEIRLALGWKEDLLTFLAIGSKRGENLLETLNVLNHFGEPLQIVVAAGNDELLYQKLHEIEWHVPVHLYKYVSHIPTFMLASDAILCKAGGLVVTEALACGTPILLVDAIPGQETGNAEYVVNGGAGEMVSSPLEMLQTVSHWMMNDRRLLKERAENAMRLGHPDAAFQVADMVIEMATLENLNLKSKWITDRKRLVDLLKKNHIPIRFSLLQEKEKAE